MSNFTEALSDVWDFLMDAIIPLLAVLVMASIIVGVVVLVFTESKEREARCADNAQFFKATDHFMDDGSCKLD